MKSKDDMEIEDKKVMLPENIKEEIKKNVAELKELLKDDKGFFEEFGKAILSEDQNPIIVFRKHYGEGSFLPEPAHKVCYIMQSLELLLTCQHYLVGEVLSKYISDEEWKKVNHSLYSSIKIEVMHQMFDIIEILQSIDLAGDISPNMVIE
jgi:hypothetical protein